MLDRPDALPTGVSPPPKPPGTIEDLREMTYPSTPLRFYPLDLGIALGIAAAVFMLFAMFVALLGNPNGMKFFEDVFPGFSLRTFWGFVAGLMWSFGTGFLLGIGTGYLYNWRLRRYVQR